MKSQEELKKEIYSFLNSQYIMSAAVSEDNKPSSTILLYYVDEELNFYFATHGNAYKAQKLRENPRISISVWNPDQMLVQTDGNVQEIMDINVKLDIVDKIAEASTKGDDFWPPLLRIKGSDYAVFKIIPYWMRKLDLKTNTMTQEGSPFEELKLQ